MTEIVLPTKKIKAESQDPQRLVIFAKPKTGKTTAVSLLDDCLILDLDDGTRSIDALKVKIETAKQLEEVCQAIYKSKKKYKYLAIDTVTKLEEFCEWEATETYMKSTIGKKFNRDSLGNVLPRKEWESVITLPQGAGYYHVRVAFKRWLNIFDKLAPRIILIAHIKDKFINEMGQEINVNAIDLTGKLAGIVTANSDSIGYLFVDRKTSNLMITFDSKFIEGGSRQEHLKGQTFPLLEIEDTKIVKNNWNKIYIS